MSAAQLDALCAAAMKVVLLHINRVAGQQVRRMKEGWAKHENA